MKKDICVNNVFYKVDVADTFFKRLFGLMFKKNIDNGLLLLDTNGIHTFFMFRNIDVFLLDKDFNIIKAYYNVKPFRVILPFKGVSHTLEIVSQNI